MKVPNAIQMEALKVYARENGRNWKSQLLEDWANARTVGPLQEMRNQFGPSWLLAHGQEALMSELVERGCFNG